MSDTEDDWVRLAEAMIFASASPVSRRALGQLLPDEADTDAVVAALGARYEGRGVELVEAGGGLQFRTAPDMAPRLRRVIQLSRRLPRVAQAFREFLVKEGERLIGRHEARAKP